MNAQEIPIGTRPAGRSMLRWYPAGWRDRYGAELVAMIEDDLAGKPPTVRFRWSIARAGVNERLRSSGLVGDSVPPAGRVRGGAFAVLGAFALFVLPGFFFAKISEHWDQATPPGSRHLPAISFNLLAALALVCGAAVLLGAAICIPNFFRFLQNGGWPAIRRRVVWAVLVTLATALALVAMVIWSRQLDNAQRNGGSTGYGILAVTFALLMAGSLATWTATAIAAARHLGLRLSQLKATGWLSAVVAVCMPIMTAAAAVWWGSIASAAPWFLAGTPTGSAPSPWAPNLVITLILMTIASAAGLFGLLRVARSWRRLPPA